MSSGAITLQCPHCGGVFLTLQHSGIIEICPHCAVGAPRSSFTASSSPVGSRLRSDLPSAKREARPVAIQAAATAQTPVLDLPFPMAPEVSAAPAPPPAPPFVPVSLTETNEARQTQQDAPSAPAQEPVNPTPSVAPDELTATDDAAIFQSASWPPQAMAAAPEVASLPPPAWPGLDRVEEAGNTIPFPTETVQRSSDPELEHREMPGRRTPWFAVAILALLIGCVTWLAVQGPEPVTVSRSSPSAPPAAPASHPGTAIAPAVTPPPVEPAPEVKPAIPNATPDAVMALRARAADEHLATITDRMVKGLENAVTHSDRLQWVDATEQQQSDMKRFFEARHGKLGSVQLEPSAGKVTLLPSGGEMKLFRLTTTTCREGAILKVREDGGKARMHWGLFEQSHEKTYDRFLAAADDGKGTARWFTLLCQRGHSFEQLKGTAEKQWICFDAQGSLGAAGTGQIYANKDSPVGRFLEGKAEWGRLYLVDLLIGRMDVEGRRLNVVLDCAGLQGGTGRR